MEQRKNLPGNYFDEKLIYKTTTTPTFLTSLPRQIPRSSVKFWLNDCSAAIKVILLFFQEVSPFITIPTRSVHRVVLTRVMACRVVSSSPCFLSLMRCLDWRMELFAIQLDTRVAVASVSKSTANMLCIRSEANSAPTIIPDCFHELYKF